MFAKSISYSDADYLETEITEKGISTASKPSDGIAKLINNPITDDKYAFMSPSTSRYQPMIENTDASIPIDFLKSKIIRSSIQKPVRKEKELQWWLGTILEVYDDSFTANLEDLEGRMNIVEFDKTIVPKNSLDNIQLDSRFTYSVRSRESDMGGIEYLTKINIFTKRNWHQKYEAHIQEVIDKILPDSLLDL